MSKRHPGNPRWGSPIFAPVFHGVLVTEFERVISELKLTNNAEMMLSPQLREWVKKHRNHKYVPEWLLKAFHFDVELHGWEY